jgi:hypothetical protein
MGRPSSQSWALLLTLRSGPQADGPGYPSVPVARHNPSPSSKPTKELLTPSGEHHEIGDEEVLMMMMATNPLLRSLERTPDQASRWRTGGGGGSVLWNTMKLPRLFFSLEIGIYSPGIRVGGATRAPQATRARLGPGACPGALWAQGGPLWWIFVRVFFIYYKRISQKVSCNSENFYFCTKTTPWQFCWKQCQTGLVPFKSCKLEAKTRAKMFGKVDTLEMYQLPQA